MPETPKSSIPAGASYYRYPPSKITLNGSNIHQGGVVATIVHQPRAFRTFQQNGDPLSFLVNFKTHVNVSLNPNRLQTLKFFDPQAKRIELSLFAERLQLGYTYNPEVIRFAQGDAFAPPTQTVSVSDTKTSNTDITVNEGLSFSFQVSDTVTVSVTDWLVSLKPTNGNVSWDYFVRSPYNVLAGQRPNRDIDKLSNTSLIGFSFDTIAWFEVFDLKQTSVSFRPSFRLQVTHLDDGVVTGRKFVHQDESSFLGDPDISQPGAEPLVIDLMRIPNRSKPKA
jgi:hypothetical protein